MTDTPITGPHGSKPHDHIEKHTHIGMESAKDAPGTTRLVLVENPDLLNGFQIAD